MSAHRRERVADDLREVLARLVREELRDPEVGFVTITAVRLSPDLRDARVFVSVLGDDADRSLRALQRASSFLRRAVAREAGLRFTPALRFVADESIERGFRIDRLLEEARPAGEDDDADDDDGGGRVR